MATRVPDSNQRPSEGRGVRIVLLGLGAINRRVAELLRARRSTAIIAGIIVKPGRGSVSANLIEGVARIVTPSELMAIAPDIILEAASQEAVREWGDVALRAARRFVVSSAGAFVDDALLCRLRVTAKRFGSQLVLSPGALAGVEALSAAARLGMHEVHHRIIKSPASWSAAGGNTSPANCDPLILFRGSAREAAKQFPLNANVTVVSALSGLGLDATIVELVSDPSANRNRHEIRASGDFGSLSIVIENRVLKANPKSSELAALALVRLAENEVTEFLV
jgi:aspartate dehydrogenase